MDEQDVWFLRRLDEFKKITRQGAGRMLGYATLPEAKFNAIIDYVLAVHHFVR